MPAGAMTPGAQGSMAGCALPHFGVFDMPEHWQAVDFMSDLHLSVAMPRTFEAWRNHLLATSADAVFLLGDVFELWVGDDMRSGVFEQRCAEVLAEASSRLQVGVMVGNRDFLLGNAMLSACGAVGLADPTVLRGLGHELLLSHGDALCLADTPYQQFRAEVRSPAWQAAFLQRPLPERLQMAADMRQASATRARFDGSAHADVDSAAAMQWLHQTGTQVLVHGHTHRPATATLAPGHVRWVLSDWDLDGGQRAEVLRLTRAGLQRRQPEGR